MSDMPSEVIGQVISSQNFVMMVIGAAVWLLGLYTPTIFLVGPLIRVCGFGLTVIATVQAAMTKPVTSAFPGLLIGGAIQVIGYYVGWIPLVGFFVGPPLVVIGGVLIVFYGSSLALQRADIPIVKDIEGFIESRKKKEVVKETKDPEEETTEESDATDQ
jgi:hypothetical protein